MASSKILSAGRVRARTRFWAGVRAQLPILLGVTPFGMIYGITAVEAGMPPLTAIAMSMIVFAGSSQFIAAELVARATPGPVIVLTTLIVNLRHMLYSASIMPYVRHLSRPWKFLLAFLMTDEVYAIAITNYRRRDTEVDSRHLEQWYFLGAGVTLWITWQISTLIGILLGASIPAGWSLDFALALTFITLLIPTLEDRPTVLAALLAGITAVLAHGLRYNLGLILAVLVGIGAGLLAERMGSQRKAAPPPEGDR